MAEGSKVRLVRCPKCDNLLPELPEYSVYQCGGCGAILRAKKRNPENDVLSEKSDEEKGGGGSDKFVEKGSDNSIFASKSEMEDGGLEHVRRQESVFVEKRANFIHGGLQRTKKKEVLDVKDTSHVSEGFKDLRLEQSVEEREYRSVDRYTRFSEHQMDPWTRGTGRYKDMNRSESVNSSIQEISTQLNRFTGSLKSRVVGWSGVGRGSRFEGMYGNNSSVTEHERAPTFAYPDEGPSNYEPYLFHGHERRLISGDHVKVPDGVKNLEQERAEILRKLDELKEQFSRSYHVADKPKEREPMDRTLPYPYGNEVPYNVLMQPPAREKQVPRPPHYNYSDEPVPYVNRHHVDRQSYYPPRKHMLNQIPEYDDPFQPQMTRKPHTLPPHQYAHVSSHEHYTGQYRNFDLQSIASYSHETFYHAPTCACLSCYNQNLRVPPQVPSAKAPINPNFYHHDDPLGIGPQSCPPPESLEPRLHARWRGELDSENDDYVHPRRMVATRKIGRLYHPIAGGAPFITCHKCFELLKLPRKLGITGNNQRRLQCGACSAVIFLEMENKKLIVSEPMELKHLSAEGNESSPEVLNDSLVSSGSLNANGTSSCSEDFKKSGYNFQSAPIEDEMLDLDESEKRRGHASSPSMSSRDGESFDCVISREEVSVSAELPIKNISPPRTRSPVWQESDSPKHVISRCGLGNKSKRMEHDSEVFSRVSLRENLVKDAAEATELDVSFEEYQNNSMSQDSAEISKEEYQYKLRKGSDSFIAGFIKKSFHDFSRSNYGGQGERPKVFVNGQPLLDRAVKRAEKYAGPICPGDYWYDFRAGFWGVMGQPCLGIIPPYIEEFNYPMPTNCGAGNTGVYVNGRELNQRDLDLLVERGLPTTRDKFYIIEISGKVMDEDTGKELNKLGRLAPTVEKAKHGFGMKVPKMVS